MRACTSRVSRCRVGGLSTPDKPPVGPPYVQPAVSYRPPKTVNFVPGDGATRRPSHAREPRQRGPLADDASDEMAEARISDRCVGSAYLSAEGLRAPDKRHYGYLVVSRRQPVAGTNY